VTGGNSGHRLRVRAPASRRTGWRVVIASRNAAASAEPRGASPTRAGRSASPPCALDLGSLRPCDGSHARSRRRTSRCAALVCNAGSSDARGPASADGFELTFAVNHLGHFLLTNLLLRLAAHAPARVVVVASGVHDPKRLTGMPKPRVADVSRSRSPRATAGSPYVHSKLCNLWFALRARAADGSGPRPRRHRERVDPGSCGVGSRARVPARRCASSGSRPARGRPRPDVVVRDQPGAKAGERSRASCRPGARDVSGRYFPSHTQLAGRAVVRRLLRRRAGGASLGGERPDDGSPADVGDTTVLRSL
jgi:hypothetical protein